MIKIAAQYLYIVCAFVQSLDFLKKSWNFLSNFPDLVNLGEISFLGLQCIMERALFLHYFFLVSVNHLFYNLDSGEKKKLFWKNSGKNLESWILKSVWTLIQILCTPMHTHVHTCTWDISRLSWPNNQGKIIIILKKVKRRLCYIHTNCYLIFLLSTTSWQ